MESTIKVKTREGKILEISESIKTYSKFIRETVEGIRTYFLLLLDSVTDDDIQCDVAEATFKKILEFFDHHNQLRDIKSIKKPVKISNFTTLTTEWDANFFKKLDDEALAELLIVL